VVNLYHRSTYVLRNYRYLARLEVEIRGQLDLSPSSVAFTREGGFYWGDRTTTQNAVKWCYIVLVGSLLFAFLSQRTYQDLMARPFLLFFVDLVISVAAAFFFVAYARSSVSMDNASSVLKHKDRNA
jgi:hypothetical protein